MSYRILHCSNKIDNYHLSIQNEVAGFTKNGPATGDIVFLAVKIKKEGSVCGVKGTLAEPTDLKPWEDADNYVSCFFMENLEYCKPFKLNILSSVGGPHWALKYIQGAIPIKDQDAIRLLEDSFKANKTDKPHFFEIPSGPMQPEPEPDPQEPEPPEEPITIMGTFQTIKFKNETDKSRGLEKLVNDNFYNCFPQYLKDKTLLIPENRLFMSSGTEARGDDRVKGIKAIPDAILLLFNKRSKTPFQINLVEYESFGELRTKAQEKSNYLNGHVIPQLMRFASAFSIVTDKHIREHTIKDWSGKIIDYIFKDVSYKSKVTSWVKELDPEISGELIGLKIHNFLEMAFKSSLRVILIIDELSSEQKQTISNVIKAFKMDNGESTEFLAYVVRLEQKIDIMDDTAEFALSIQQ